MTVSVELYPPHVYMVWKASWSRTSTMPNAPICSLLACIAAIFHFFSSHATCIKRKAALLVMSARKTCCRCSMQTFSTEVTIWLAAAPQIQFLKFSALCEHQPHLSRDLGALTTRSACKLETICSTWTLVCPLICPQIKLDFRRRVPDLVALLNHYPNEGQ